MPATTAPRPPASANLFVASRRPPGGGTEEDADRSLQDAREQPYGIIVADGFPSSASLEEARLCPRRAGKRAAGQPSDPGYKVYPDGRRRVGAGPAVSRVECPFLEGHPGGGDDNTRIRVHEQPAPFALIGASSFTAETCVGGALHSDRRSGAASDGGGVAQTAVASAPELVR